MSRMLIRDGKMIPLEDAPTMQVPPAAAKVDLVADMRRRHGIADPAEAKAEAPKLRVDIVADMKRRHGIIN